MALKHAQPGEVVHLPPSATDSFPAKTAALVKTDRFEAVRLVVRAGTSIAQHKVDGYISLQCLDGHAILETDRDIELRAGDWAYLDRNASHAVRGIADSTLLLTIMFD